MWMRARGHGLRAHLPRLRVCAYGGQMAFGVQDGRHSMTKSELIELISRKQSHLAAKDIELAVKMILERMSGALSTGRRIEIRGFGSFSLHFRPPRMGRNPKTGDAVALPGDRKSTRLNSSHH